MRVRTGKGRRLSSLTGGVLLVASMAASACTKVREQPQLPVRPISDPTRQAAPPPAKRPRPFASRLEPVSAGAPTPPVVVAAHDAGEPTLNGDPKGLKFDDLKTVLDGAMPSFMPCFQSGGGAGGGSVGLTFNADPSGSATNVSVSGVSAEVGRCVAGAVQRLSFPTFEGKAVPVRFPLAIQRSVQAPPPPPVVVPPPATPPPSLPFLVPPTPPPGTPAAPTVAAPPAGAAPSAGVAPSEAPNPVVQPESPPSSPGSSQPGGFAQP